MTRKIAMGIEYDGSAFHGWQKQLNAVSVQSTLELALNKVAGHDLNASNRIHTVCAGRTDTGVHATEQVVHFETDLDRRERAWVFGTNAKLPPTVRALWAKEVPADFNARRTATSRRYRYVIYNHPIRPSLQRSLVTWYYRPLTVERMIAASKYWIGKHDFSSFRASGCQSRTPIRIMQSISIVRVGEQVILEFKANAFLHHMVRNMVGVLLKIGSHLAEIEWADAVLNGRDRRLAGITAPPEGLYLVQVEYPDIYQIPRDTLGPWFLKLSEDSILL